MVFSDRDLASRLEAAEGQASAQFAQARRKFHPESGAEWTRIAGTYVVFDGVDSPVTQTFGLGIYEELRPSSLDTIESFFFERGAHIDHEVSPHAGVRALDLLCERGYRPIEACSVLYQPLALNGTSEPGDVNVRIAGPGEEDLWADVSLRAWTHEHPELGGFIRQMSRISLAREHTVCFFAEIDGRAGAAGALCLHDGVALLAGAATVPELRRRGLQRALLHARLRYATEHGCDLAMMVAEVGSASQRNAERAGFRIAYTRTKWRLPHP
jgi:GNAT superfamily N-acetyltransferase